MPALFEINIKVATNEDFQESIVITGIEENTAGEFDPIDLTAHSFEMHIRKTVDALSAFELHAENGRLFVLGDPVNGVLAWDVEDEDWAALGAGTFVHDIVWTFPDGSETLFATGTVTISQGITR